MRPIIILVFLLFLSPLAAQEEGAYRTKDIQIGFVIDTRFGAVKGKFANNSLQIINYVKGIATITVDISSIATGIKFRDDHLKGEDFFNVEKYPRAVFQLKTLAAAEEGKFKASGSLTIKGITKDYDFIIIKTFSDKVESYSGSIYINRSDFKIDFNSSVNKIDESVQIDFKVALEQIK